MASTNFKVFAENATKGTTLLDDNDYESNEVRLKGNIAGSIAQSKPNNNALHQSTLASAALASYMFIQTDDDVLDTDSSEVLANKLNQAVSNHITKTIRNSEEIVHTSNDENVDGIKTFVTLPESSKVPIKDQQLVNKQYVDEQDSKVLSDAKAYADVAGSNVLLDAKNYTDAALEQAKKYTDDQIANGCGESTGIGGVVLAPDIISPANGAQDVIISTALTAGPFRSAYADNTRTARQFQLTKTDWDSCDIDIEVNSNSYTPITLLDSNQDYKWRCRDKTKYGLTSPWSSEASFETGGDLTVNQPTITVEGAPSSVDDSPTLTGSRFGVSQGSDTHQMTDWRIKLASNNSIVWSSLNNSSKRTSIVVPKGYLKVSTKYLAEVRYRGAAYNWSKWSSAVSFTTISKFDSIATPTVNVEGAPSSVTDNPDITTSAFTVDTVQGTRDTHVSTDWRIKRGSSIIWQSLNNSTNKTSITIPKGVLSNATAYTAEVRFKGSALGYSNYGSAAFNTKAQFASIAAPTLTVEGASSSVPETPTLTGGAFSIVNGSNGQQDTHQMTDWVVMNSIGTTEIWSSKNNTSDLKSITLPKGELSANTQYQFKVRYKGANLGWSPYTSVTARTKSSFFEIKTPVLSISDNTSEVFSRFVADTTGFFPMSNATSNGKTHVSTTWKLYKTTSSTPVWQSLNDTTNLEEIGVDYTLSASTKYRLTCQFNGLNGAVSDIAEITFTSALVPSSYIDITMMEDYTNTTLKDLFQSNTTWSSTKLKNLDVYIDGVLQDGVTINSTTTVRAGQRIEIKAKNGQIYPALTKGAMYVGSLNKPYPKFSKDGTNASSDLSHLFSQNSGQSPNLKSIVNAPFRFCDTTSGRKKIFTSAEGVFYQCVKLTTLPNFMFMYVDSATNGEYLAYWVGATTIPKKFFKHRNQKTSTLFGDTHYTRMFANASITSLPSKLLEPLVLAKTIELSYVFEWCRRLKSVPSDLFGNGKYMPLSVGLFQIAGLTSVGTDLFTNLTQVSSDYKGKMVLKKIFDLCESLSSLTLRLRFPSNTLDTSGLGGGAFSSFASNRPGTAGTVYVIDNTMKQAFDSSSGTNVNAIVG